ncbi:tRNA pseudouridine(13) synthase TruD [Methylomarinum vadi]|uniref:tRNA pseudouridine(13) synthase TruD n=1 Tax=Methylomarinum vadi TaxID=438855 RepID=UPI0006915FDA|nr:tRNA pseudouridine(13) synthase TruD [Methylomarinum vadi]
MQERRDISIPEWPYAWGGPVGTGIIKASADDFIVKETLPFIPEGSGEHVFLWVEKVGENTEYAARVLARCAGIRQRDVGFAGLKDRHARTRQWFSLWLPGMEEPDWSQAETATIKILKTVRHARKLKRGVIAANHFRIRIRNWRGDRVETLRRLEQIGKNGFPNYFAEQRFGRNGQNVNKALALADGKRLKREQRSLYLSAIRSYLFNSILAERVRQDNWNRLLEGDCCQLRHSQSQFWVDDIDDLGLRKRMQDGDINPTGILWGKGEHKEHGRAGVIEKEITGQFPELTELLSQFDLKLDRRAFRAFPGQLQWRYSSPDELEVEFSLSAGSYATALLREMIVIEQTLLNGKAIS